MLIVDLLLVSELGEGLQSPQVVIHSTLLLGEALVLSTVTFFFKALLDFVLDQEGLAGSCSNELGTLLLKFLLIVVKRSFFVVELGTLGLEKLTLGQKLQTLNFDLVSNLIYVSLSVVIARQDHPRHLLIIGDNWV